MVMWFEDITNKTAATDDDTDQEAAVNLCLPSHWEVTDELQLCGQRVCCVRITSMLCVNNEMLCVNNEMLCVNTEYGTGWEKHLD